MLTAGDEIRRTQRGNNNAYCQDNAISWFDWRLQKKHEDIRRFVREIVRFRKNEITVRQPYFLTGQPRTPGGLPDISWYGAQGGSVPWNHALDRSLTCLLAAVPPTMDHEGSLYHVMMMFHGGWESRDFSFPAVCQNFSWRLFVDTAAPSPNDIFPDNTGLKPNLKKTIKFEPHSMRIFLAEAR